MNQKNNMYVSPNYQGSSRLLENENYQTEILDPPKIYIAVFNPEIILLSDNWELVYSLIYSCNAQGCNLLFKICSFITEEQGRIFLNRQLINFIGNVNNWRDFSIPILSSVQLNMAIRLDQIEKTSMPSMDEINDKIIFDSNLF